MLYFVLIMGVILLWFMFGTGTGATSDYNVSLFERDLKDSKVGAVDVSPSRDVPTGSVLVTMSDSTQKTFYVFDTQGIIDLMDEYHFTNYVTRKVPAESWLTSLLPLLLVFAAMFILFTIMNNQAGGGGNAQMMNFGKSRARMSNANDKQVGFDNVAGLKEEKEELEELVDFLRAPEKYTKLGARIPKGVLLVGPPGTGKTLLAKAVAGEAGVPFFSISGSDFVEMFVGVGASRVRDLFEDAKRNAPCIVFIDEIDAVARRRMRW